MNKKLMTMGLAALMLAGCSSDDLVTEEGQGVAQDKNAYVTLRLSLPSTSGSRADNFENDKFAEGEANEYKVNSLAILFFKVDDALPDNETLETVYSTDLTGESKLDVPAGWSGLAGDGHNVATEVLLPALKVKDANKKHIVVLVNNDYGAGGTSKHVSYTEGTTTLTNLLASKNTSATVADYTGTTDNFFMSNAPYYDGANFVKVPSNEAYRTKEEAQAHPVSIYLERAVGKVTVKVGTGAVTGHGAWHDKTYNIDNTSGLAYRGASITFTNWNLDITNKSMYAFHQFDGAWSSTSYFVGGNAPYRIYWAKDDNYDWDLASLDESARKTKMNETFNRFEENLGTTPAPALTTEMGKNEYCFENTFTVQNMSQDQTTRVLLQANYIPADAGGNPKFSDPTTFYMVGESTTALDDTELKAKISAAVKSVTGIDCPFSDIKLDNVKANAATKYQLTATDVILAGLTTTDFDNINAWLGGISVYKNGVCYYVARVKHFGSEYTKWGGEASPEDYTDYIKNYGAGHEDKWLGRYGIVRNNWYELTLNKVSAPGSPVVPETGKTCDDVQDYYLQADVKILSWAKRSQSVDL